MEFKKYKDFRFSLIIERLGINKEIDEYSDKIYEIIKSDKKHFTFTDLPNKTNINKLIINIKTNFNKLGELNLKENYINYTIIIKTKKAFLI